MIDRMYMIDRIYMITEGWTTGQLDRHLPGAAATDTRAHRLTDRW
jgi:hypothetical protein